MISQLQINAAPYCPECRKRPNAGGGTRMRSQPKNKGRTSPTGVGKRYRKWFICPMAVAYTRLQVKHDYLRGHDYET